jgi:drug/metabolite transporter (DMT)-like permease
VEQNTLQKVDSLRYKAIVMQLSAAILWSFGGLLIKLVDLNPIAIAGIRSIIASFVIFVFLKKSSLKLTWNKAFGAISYTSMVILFVSATKATTAANAIMLQYTSPIYIAIFGGWLLNEKAKLREWTTIIFVIGGMVLFFMDDMAGGSMKGNILAVLSGIALGFNTIFMRREKDADPLENVFWGSILTILVSIPFIFEKAPSPKGWIGLILLGVFQLGLSYVLYARAIKKITALESTFISLIEPLLNPLWVFLTIAELPGRLSVMGGLIVLVSVTVSCLKPKRHVAVELMEEKTV